MELKDAFKNLSIEGISSREELNKASDDEDRAICPMCGLIYRDDGGFWVCCDGCDVWFDLKCTDIKSEKLIPEEYYCHNCKL